MIYIMLLNHYNSNNIIEMQDKKIFAILKHETTPWYSNFLKTWQIKKTQLQVKHRTNIWFSVFSDVGIVIKLIEKINLF